MKIGDKVRVIESNKVGKLIDIEDSTTLEYCYVVRFEDGILGAYEECDLEEIKICEHKNIVVAHYAIHVEGEIGDRVSCKVICRECDKVLFDSKNRDIELAYQYIENNKEKIDTLMDMTCDNLNERYSIKEMS